MTQQQLQPPDDQSHPPTVGVDAPIGRVAVVDVFNVLLNVSRRVQHPWVELVLGSVDERESHGHAFAILLPPGIPVRATPHVHDKAFVVYARYADSANPRYMVFTGSHNLSLPALRQNDELFVRIHDNQTIHDGFYRHFLDAYSIGTPVS